MSIMHTIEEAFEHRETLSPSQTSPRLQMAITTALQLLDSGDVRVAEKKSTGWIVHEWLKKAILLSFKIQDSTLSDSGYTHHFDKVAPKFAGWTAEQFNHAKIRVVPPAAVRYGSYIAPHTVIMPSFINLGTYIDSGTLIDTWATVGSCAQIGKNVHLSGGVGIGGVLEPLQAQPTIIEDDCFIGARSEIVEGVIIEQGSVISMGVFIGQSTPIYNRYTKTITYGKIPAGSVVIPGSLPSADGLYNRYAAIIVKQVDAQTRAKTTLNELLRPD